MSWDLGEKHKPNHNSYVLYYHTVFVTDRREPLIDRELEAFLRSFFGAKCEEMSVNLLAEGIVCDHVHLVVSLRPSHYIPEVMNYLKGTSAHEANHHHEFKNSLRWMRGYRMDTVSARNLEAAKNYTEAQYERHPDRIPE